MDTTPADAERSEILSATQAGASFAALLTIIAISDRNEWADRASIALVLSVPLSLLHAMLCWNLRRRPLMTERMHTVLMLVGAGGGVSTFAGLALLVASLSPILGTVFSLAVLIGFLVWRDHDKRLLALVLQDQKRQTLDEAIHSLAAQASQPAARSTLDMPG